MGEAADILTEAHGLVRGARLQHYGPPTENFKRIADLWTAYFGPTLTTPVTEQDVCALMILLKQARIKTGGGYHRDSAVDTAGYAALQEILDEGVREFGVTDADCETNAEVPQTVIPDSVAETFPAWREYRDRLRTWANEKPEPDRPAIAAEFADGFFCGHLASRSADEEIRQQVAAEAPLAAAVEA